MTDDHSAFRHRRARGHRRSRRGRRRRASERRSTLLIAALAVAAAVGAAFSAAHPTGNPTVDVVERVLFAALVVAAAGRSGRWTWLVLAAVAIIFSRGVWLVPAALAAAVALAGVAQPRHRRRLGALAAAVGVQSVLRFAPVGFHGATALAAAAAVVPVLVSGYRHTHATLRRHLRHAALGLAAAAVVVSIPLLVAAVLARSPLTNGVDEAKQAFDLVGGADPQAARASLTDAAENFSTAAAKLDAWWTAPAELVPIVGQHRRAVATTARLAQHVTRQAAASAARADYDTLTAPNSTIDLAKVAALLPPVSRLNATLTDAHARLAQLPTGWLVAPLTDRIDTFRHEIATALPQTRLARNALRVAPAILGADGPRHYFVAFTTPAEQRGLGGFIGSYAELVADHGTLTMTRSGPIGDLNPGPDSPPRTLTGPADYLARYGSFQPQKFFQDLTYAPDLPTDAKVISQLYPQAGGDRLDGVLVVDPYALAALLHFTGPVRIAGLSQTLTPANAAEVLLKDQYAQFQGTNQERKDALSDAGRAVFTRLTHGTLPSPKALADTLSPLVHQRHLGVYSTHPDAQALFRELGAAMRFPRPDGGDLLAVTTQNGANNKIDVYLHRTLHDQVTVDTATGQVHSVVTVTLHNAAPATGLPPEVSGALASPELAPGTNRTFVSVYSPLALRGATVADGAGDSADQATPRAMTAGVELGWSVYATTVDIRPGGTVTLTLTLDGQLPRHSPYRLRLPVQPQVNPDRVSIDISPTANAADPSSGAVSVGPFTLTTPRTITAHLHGTG